MSHSHGNITNSGLVGTTSGLPLKTGTGGIVEAGAFGTSAGQFAEGNHTHAASAITSGTFDNARINFASPAAIGNTTPAAITATTLNANGSGSALVATFGTATAAVNQEIEIWGNAAGRNHLIRANAGSGVDFRMTSGGGAHCGLVTGATPTGFRQSANSAFAWSNHASNALAGSTDTFIFRDAADTVAQRNGSNGQAYRLYNTFTDASNYERGFMRWSSNVLQIGTEALGTGSARALELQTGGTTRFTIATNGAITCSSSLSVTSQIVFQGNANIAGNIGGGIIRLNNHLSTGFDRLQFGGGSASFPALKRSSTALQVRLADDSAFAPFECAGLTLNGNLDASTRDLVTDTTTGTKIGTGTTQKLGFFNATPVVQQAAVADATDAASVIARLNDLLARLRTLGLIAT